jgi:hypothetical protein
VTLGVLESFRFRVNTDVGPEWRVGYQVGRFAIHEVPKGDNVNPVARHMARPLYAVVHVPTGTTFFYAQKPEEALLLADDISRFSAKDPSSKNEIKVVGQLGPNVMRWARVQFGNAREGRRICGFREFMRN